MRTWALLALTACSASTKPEIKPDESLESVKEFSTRGLYGELTQPGCKSMLDSYCDYLYSPENSGNLKVKKSQGPLMVLQGQTKNDFPVVFYEYSKSKLRNRDYLPRDFRESLESRAYFDMLRVFIERKPREQMSLGDRLTAVEQEEQLDALWESALTETVLKRMDAKFHGFHRIKEPLVPIELQIERRRVRRKLISDISKSIWKHHPNWVRVENSFESLKKHYLTVLDRTNLSEATRQDWKSRVSSVKLIIPGAMPEISDDECSTTQVNAFYYPYLNVLTVCAGDFNGEDILQTMAHELGHSLDIQRSRYLAQRNSKIGGQITQLRKQVCSEDNAQFSCQAWSQFKAGFAENVKSLRGYNLELPQFQKCLQRRQTTRVMQEPDIERLATQVVTEQISDLADSDIFLRITKPKIPLPNGKLQVNPNYMNPCSYYLWTSGEEPIDDELTSLVFFTAEYQCGAGEPPARMRQALATTKQLSLQIAAEAIRMEGEFSPRKLLETEGYSSSPVERFADVLGSYALADLLKEVPSEWDRRNIFLASSSWQCTKPSLANSFPEESAVQREYVFDSHTDGDERKKESFSMPIREALGCRKDFSFDECTLSFASPATPPEVRAPANSVRRASPIP